MSKSRKKVQSTIPTNDNLSSQQNISTIQKTKRTNKSSRRSRGQGSMHTRSIGDTLLKSSFISKSSGGTNSNRYYSHVREGSPDKIGYSENIRIDVGKNPSNINSPNFC